MKTIMITAPSSGSGKTTVTMGLIRALRNKGLDVCGYKIGPDYNDRAFLEAEQQHKSVVRLHTGDPTIYGAIRRADGLSRPGDNTCYY